MAKARGQLVAVVLSLGVLVGACTSDSPEQDLPCDFYFNQRDSGLDVDIPENCEELTPPTTVAAVPSGDNG